MSVSIKTLAEQDGMRVAGRLAGEVLGFIAPHVQAGVTTAALDRLCHDYIVEVQKAVPAPLNYGGEGHRRPFPKSICTSINSVVCHGIPDESVLKDGDIINIDVTVIKDGWHGDTSRMFVIGDARPPALRLVNNAREALLVGIELVKPGARLGDIGHAIQQHVKAAGYSVVREYCGHGIGREFHEDPQVLHYGRPNTGLRLEPGMCFTIEPMVNAGTHEVRLLRDHWTVMTKDYSLSAQWEHTVLVTATGHEVLTRRADEAL